MKTHPTQPVPPKAKPAKADIFVLRLYVAGQTPKSLVVLPPPSVTRNTAAHHRRLLCPCPCTVVNQPPHAWQDTGVR